MEIPHGFIENNILHRNAFGEIQALELSELRENKVEESVNRMVDSFEKIKSKLEAIFTKVDDSQNKGSFLSGLLTLKNSLVEHKGLGDYQALLDRIEIYELLLRDFVEKNRQKNTEIKRALLLELEVIVANNDMVEAFEQIKDLKSRWVKTGGASEDVSEKIELNFTEGLNGFFEKRKTFLEAKNLLKQARVEDYQKIIDEIRIFVKKKDFKTSVKRVKELQVEWKEAGRIPEDEFKKLNDAYWKVCQQYFESVKAFRNEEKKSKSGNQKEVLQTRKELLRKLEDLAERCLDNVQKEFIALKEEWKKAGSLPKTKFSEMQGKFNSSCDDINEQSFILQLAIKKNKGFVQKVDKEKLQISMQVLKKLLRRDKNELASFSENMGKMHINKGSFVDMLESKLKAQERKVEKKQRLLKKYQDKYDRIKSS